MISVGALVVITRHLSLGDRIEFVLDDNGCLLLLPVTRPVHTLKGMLPKPAKPVTSEVMDAAIIEAVMS